MTEAITRKISDSAGARWAALFIVAFTMMAAYFVNDIMAPLKTMLETNRAWSSTEFGFYTGAYSFLNVFILMLIWGGLILDRFGIRFTGITAATLMVVGTGIEYYGLNALNGSEALIFGHRADVFVTSAGYSIFGVGAEIAGITVTKIIAKWFKGKELATAMGAQVALARIGSQGAYALAIPIAEKWSLSTPVFIGLMLLVGGLAAFIVFSFMDKKLDRQAKLEEEEKKEESFSFKDVVTVVSNPGFWLIALLCVLFYSCIFPFQKFATELMVTKYGIDKSMAGFIAGMPALGALILTPAFGGLIDKKGKAASLMALGAAMLIFVHGMYAIPGLQNWIVAIVLMVILGIAFSLVPSAMWPSVAKIFPVRQLGTAYSLIFWVQNIGLWGMPFLIGWILDTYCIIGSKTVEAEGKMTNVNTYDYTLPMCVFTFVAVLSLIIAFALKSTDKKKGYGLEQPNIKKN